MTVYDVVAITPFDTEHRLATLPAPDGDEAIEEIAHRQNAVVARRLKPGRAEARALIAIPGDEGREEWLAFEHE